MIYHPNQKPPRWSIDPGIIIYNCQKYGMPPPILAMPLWESAGKRVFDYSGYGNCGTIPNGPTWLPDGLDFDGNDDYIDLGSIPNGHSLNLAGSDVTICLRLNWDGTGDSFQRFVDKANGGAGLNGYSTYNTANNLIFAVDGGNSIYTNSNPLVAGTWQDIFFIHRNNSALGQIFVNNIEASYTSRSSLVIPSGTTNMKIGSWYSTGREYKGQLAYITIYNCALLTSQRKFLYENPYFMYQIPEELYGYVAEAPPVTFIPRIIMF